MDGNVLFQCVLLLSTLIGAGIGVYCGTCCSLYLIGKHLDKTDRERRAKIFSDRVDRMRETLARIESNGR